MKSYNVLYSQDNIIWNKILDDVGKPREFLANVDSENEKKIFFKNPIKAQYLKIQPTRWHVAIEIKLEPIGCYEPYRKIILTISVSLNFSNLVKALVAETTIKPKDEIEIVTPSTCGVCQGVLMPRPVDADSCVCYPPLVWSGSECVPKSQCPCVEGHMAYEIGETYQTENCSDCVCKIGGIPDCKPKICPPCGKGLRRASPQTCSCRCDKCPPDTIVCPTSGECIPEANWCDGVQDCPDDETGCIVTEKPSIHINRTETIGKACGGCVW